MRDISEYPLNTAIALLLGGDTGTGKSTSLLYWPKPWILDLEGNLIGAIKEHQKRLGRLPIGKWDRPHVADDNKTPVPLEQQWTRCQMLIDRAVADPEVGTICLDGLGRLYDMLKQYLAHNPAEKPIIVSGQRQMGLAQWGVYPDLLKRFIWDLRSKGKPLIVTAHLKIDENELTKVSEYRIADLQADFGKSDSLPKCFSDYFQTMNAVTTKDAANPRGVRYYYRTAPSTRNPKLKTSFPELPDEFSPGDAVWTELMKKVGGVAAPVEAPK